MFVWVFVANYYLEPSRQPSLPLTVEEVDKLAVASVSQLRFEHLARCAGSGLVFGIGSAAATWLALLVIPWIWYFVLARLRELSNAVRGK